ncbi:MAG: hypothetical protein JW751_25910, partial [Polyangiaceae bacterium]|nr:hypothetical protein [Polyangiaceae bacterium]
MALETSTRSATFESRSDDGIHAVIQRAADAVASDELDSGGWLEIVPASRQRNPSWCIEAVFSDDGLRHSLAKVDVRLRSTVAQVEAALVHDAVTAFGGTEYTNLCFAADDDASSDAGSPESPPPPRGAPPPPPPTPPPPPP